MAVIARLVCVLVGLRVVLGLGDTYYIGAGRYDITGPSAQIELMGYASLTQIDNGIHLRQFSRAFIFADAKKQSRVVFVNADVCMATQIMKIQVIKKLQSIFGDMYTDNNVLISGVHTHSGPAGYFQYLLFEVMSLGFVKQSLDAIVNGIVESIKIAHKNMKLGTLSFGTGMLYDASINRSPSAYLANPSKERSKYKYNTDKRMSVLKMVDTEGKDIGMIDWFAVHCTSMNNTNSLISSDNKGFASLLMEKVINGPATLPGTGDFVAAFAQSNEGDVSPNTKGPHCMDSGKPCNFYHSTCHGENELCIASGPGKDMFDSTRIIATKQFEMGKKLYNSTTIDIIGTVNYIGTHVDFSDITLNISGKMVHTCPPAMGYSFAAGTTDGPGAFNFKQGTTTSNPFWNAVRNIIKKPSKKQIACHTPKPILLDTGGLNFPYPWQPRIMPLQLLQIGQLVIIGVPGEFTTMSGRRLRAAVKQTLLSNGFSSDAIAVIAGLSNTYSNYITTFEEYQVQRYEGASTIFGPHTLSAYIKKFTELAAALAKGKTVSSGPPFPNYLKKQLSFQAPIFFDHVPIRKRFGSVKTDVKDCYRVNETVMVKFWSGNPRNNLMIGKSFLTVQIQKTSGKWQTLYTDASWETKFSWKQTNTLLGYSIVTITWDIPTDVTLGTYRIQHFGYHKPLLFSPRPYSGVSSRFKVKAQRCTS